MALGQGFAQARVRAQVKRRLALLVADAQVGTIGCQEAGDGGGALLLRSLGPQSHNQLHKTCKSEKEGIQNNPHSNLHIEQSSNVCGIPARLLNILPVIFLGTKKASITLLNES